MALTLGETDTWLHFLSISGHIGWKEKLIIILTQTIMLLGWCTFKVRITQIFITNTFYIPNSDHLTYILFFVTFTTLLTTFFSCFRSIFLKNKTKNCKINTMLNNSSYVISLHQVARISNRQRHLCDLKFRHGTTHLGWKMMMVESFVVEKY